MNNIKYLLSEPDNAEKVRSQIAAILKVEIEAQAAMAAEAALPDAGDYNIGVLIEHERLWALTGNTKEDSPFPLVNVLLLETRPVERGGNLVNAKDYTAKFAIDCYGCGNFDMAADENGEPVMDDFLANIRAWKTARVARNILMSAFYTYLGMRAIVKRREITETKTGVPDNLPESSVAVTVCRIIFSVQFTEVSPQADVEPFDGILFKSVSNTGEDLIDI
jgi:hypothetical protein